MFENKVEVLNMARAMAAHAAARQGIIARNMANADTPGYRAADLPEFAEAWRSSGDTAMRMTRSAHLSGGRNTTLTAIPELGNVGPNGNSVSLETEMVKAAEVKQQHDMALAIYSSLSGVVRTALGRR
ncbi:MAG: FlgB family protein [Gemmobacter sp.]|nr:FlgB family protein [Gemmobacter sp.]